MSAAALRVGWCPGALRPMASGDGLIVRVKPRGASLTLLQAGAIAGAAARHGNGLLDLTARANVQVRGVTEAGLPALTIDLDDVGLLDADPAAESRRNVLVSPLAGLDPTAAFDIRPAVTALEAALVDAEDLGDLPSKFGVAVSDGGLMRLSTASADIRIEAARDGRFVVRLDGDDRVVATCTTRGLPDVALGFMRGFAAWCATESGLRRMRDLVARVGPEAVLDGPQWTPHPSERRSIDSSLTNEGRRQNPPFRVPQAAPRVENSDGDETSYRPREHKVGLRPDRAATDEPSVPIRPIPFVGPFTVGSRVTLGVAAPFGRLDARQFEVLVRGAVRAGAEGLRVTPWRALLVPGLSPEAADRLAKDCGAVDLIVDAADPRLRVAACPGSPGCRRGTTPVLEHAAAWAALIGSGDSSHDILLHVSGCAKGCAHPGPAPLTLVATEGRYSLVIGEAPWNEPVASGLAVGEVRHLLPINLGLDRCP